MLVKGARCAFQFYPSGPEQAEMITNAALKNGFTGGLIVDFPNSKKAKKFFLLLMAGYSDEIAKDAERAVMLPKARTEGENYSESEYESGDSDEDMDGSDSDEDEEASSSADDGPKVGVAGKKTKFSKTIQKKIKGEGRFKANDNRKSRQWILKKKDRQRRQGNKVKSDSKYSGRKRSKAF